MSPTPKRPRSRDVNTLAAEIVAEATADPVGSERESEQEPESVTFGREGGKKRAEHMTAEERSEAARKAVRARWDKQKS